MKICHFEINTPIGQLSRLGVIKDDKIIDVNLCWENYYHSKNFHNAKERAQHNAPSSLYAILQLKETPLEFFQETISLAEKLKNKNFIFDLKNLLAPLDKINCYRDFYAHEKHVSKGFEKRNEEIPRAWYEFPAYYKGSTSTFIGPGQDIKWPSFSNKLDYELELAAIIGRSGKNILEKDAGKHIFGYTILNDVSARDLQKKEMTVRLGPAKSKDFCSVIGPIIITADEFNYETPKLKMTAKINGDLWSEGISSDANFSFEQMITHASKEEWIIPSDLFGSGTVGTGCGLEIDKWIQPKDTIELIVEKIGTLSNKVIKEG